MGPGQKILTRVGLDHESGSFLFFSLQVKKISSGWVKKYQGHGRVSPLFTAGQKYAQGPSLPQTYAETIKKEIFRVKLKKDAKDHLRKSG